MRDSGDDDESQGQMTPRRTPTPGNPLVLRPSAATSQPVTRLRLRSTQQNEHTSGMADQDTESKPTQGGDQQEDKRALHGRHTRGLAVPQSQMINLTPGKARQEVVPSVVTPGVDLTRQGELRARMIRDLARTDPVRAYLQGLAYLEEGMALRESAHGLVIPVIEECSKVPGFDKMRKADISRWKQAEGIKKEHEETTHKVQKAWEAVERNWGPEVFGTLRPLARHYAYAAACRKMSRSYSWATIRNCSHLCTLRRIQGANKNVESQYYQTVATDIQNAEKICRLEGPPMLVEEEELHAWRLYQRDDGLLAQLTEFHLHLIQAKRNSQGAEGRHVSGMVKGSENVRPQSIPETQDWTEPGSEDPNATEETDLMDCREDTTDGPTPGTVVIRTQDQLQVRMPGATWTYQLNPHTRRLIEEAMERVLMQAGLQEGAQPGEGRTLTSLIERSRVEEIEGRLEDEGEESAGEEVVITQGFTPVNCPQAAPRRRRSRDRVYRAPHTTKRRKTVQDGKQGDPGLEGENNEHASGMTTMSIEELEGIISAVVPDSENLAFERNAQAAEERELTTRQLGAELDDFIEAQAEKVGREASLDTRGVRERLEHLIHGEKAFQGRDNEREKVQWGSRDTVKGWYQREREYRAGGEAPNGESEGTATCKGLPRGKVLHVQDDAHRASPRASLEDIADETGLERFYIERDPEAGDWKVYEIAG